MHSRQCTSGRHVRHSCALVAQWCTTGRTSTVVVRAEAHCTGTVAHRSMPVTHSCTVSCPCGALVRLRAHVCCQHAPTVCTMCRVSHLRVHQPAIRAPWQRTCACWCFSCRTCSSIVRRHGAPVRKRCAAVAHQCYTGRTLVHWRTTHAPRWCICPWPVLCQERDGMSGLTYWQCHTQLYSGSAESLHSWRPTALARPRSPTMHIDARAIKTC